MEAINVSVRDNLVVGIRQPMSDPAVKIDHMTHG